MIKLSVWRDIDISDELNDGWILKVTIHPLRPVRLLKRCVERKRRKTQEIESKATETILDDDDDIPF